MSKENREEQTQTEMSREGIGAGCRRGTEGAFLAMAALAYGLGGSGLCMMTVLLGKNLLPGWLETVYLLLGGAAGLALGAVYFSVQGADTGNGVGKIKKYWLGVLETELWLWVVFRLWRLSCRFWSAPGRERGRVVFAAGIFLLTAAALAGAGLLIHRLVRQCGRKLRRKGPLGLLLTVAALALGTGAAWAVGTGLDHTYYIFVASLPGILGAGVCKACCGYGAVRLIMTAVCSPAGGPEEEEPAGEGPADAGKAVRKKFRIPPLVGTGVSAAAVLLLFLLTQGMLGEGGRLSGSAAERAMETVEEAVRQGYRELEEGRTTEAAVYFARARVRAEALESLVGESQTGKIGDIDTEYARDPVIAALYLSRRGIAPGLESGIRSSALGMDWYPVLLRYYAEREKNGPDLSEGQKLLREEMLLRCVAEKQFVSRNYVSAEDLEGHELAVRKALMDYGEQLAVCRLFELQDQYNRSGGYTAETALEALGLAEAWPDNMLLQYIACQAGSNYQVDNAAHYGRTVEAAERFDRLYDDGSRSTGELSVEKLAMGDAAVRCYDYDTALAFYEASFRLSKDAETALVCAQVYEKRKEYDKCLELAEEVLELEPDNVRALYLTALSALKTKDRDKALESAGRLGDLIADVNRPVDPAEENYLYVLAEYMAMKDTSRWTDFVWEFYHSLDGDQDGPAGKHPLFWHYMTAIYQCFEERNFEAAAEAAEKITEIREDLAMGWYLRGTIAFSEQSFTGSQDNYDEILEYYGKAEKYGGVSPAIYFSLANVYDAKGDYENARRYSRKVEQMLPYQDHGNDIYGISVHNVRLLEELEKELGR